MTHLGKSARLLLLLLLSSAAWADATLYRWVDDQGVVHYSDTPQPGAEKVHIAAAQTFPAQPGSSSQSSPSSPAAASQAQSCAITQPTPEQSFYAPETVAVEVDVTPRLEGAAQLVVTLDGAAVQPAQAAAHGYHYQLANVDRGSHTVTAEVRDGAGHLLCNASPVNFYVQRPSLLSPQSPAKGH
jgi:hypothetical protein